MVLPDDNLDDDFLPLLEDHQDLPFHDGNDGAYYMGGVGGGLGLGASFPSCMQHYKDLTSL